MKHPRVPEWRSRLAAVFADRRDAPFASGSNDCALFAADCVLATCGYDAAKGLRSHRTPDQAAATLKRVGGLRKIAGERFGERIKAEQAAPGDVGLIVVERVSYLAVWGGSAWLAPHRTGLVAHPREAARIAWRCER